MNKKERARQIIIYELYITSFCCIQVTFSRVFHLFGRTCDFMLVFVVLAGYLFGTVDGMVVGAIVGVFRDYFSGPVITGMNRQPIALMGVGVLSFFYIGLVSSLLFRKKFRRKYNLSFLQVAILSLIYYSLGHIVSWVYLTVSGSLVHYHSLRYIVFSSILPQTFVNLLAAFPMLLLLRFAGPYKKGVRSSLVDGYSVEDRKWQSI